MTISRISSDAFQLSLPGFDGPVEVLPSLVASRQLALDQLQLAEIPAQFLAATRRQEEIDLDVAGEVLASVARLMFMKSVQLLAQPVQETTDAEDGPPRHRTGDAGPVRAAALRLGELQGRESFPAPGRLDLVPRRTESRSPGLLLDAWRSIAERDARGVVRAVVPAFVKLEVAMSRMLRGLRGRGTLSFLGLVKGANRRDAVVHFLAALELVRRGQAVARQSGLFSDIALEWAEDAAERQSRAG